MIFYRGYFLYGPKSTLKLFSLFFLSFQSMLKAFQAVFCSISSLLLVLRCLNGLCSMCRRMVQVGKDPKII